MLFGSGSRNEVRLKIAAFVPVLFALASCGNVTATARGGTDGDTGTGGAAGTGGGGSTIGGGGVAIDVDVDGGTAAGPSLITDAGPYELPADYTATNIGGYKLGDPIVPDTPPNAPSGNDCNAIVGVVRDFKDNDEPGGHPDFETYLGRTASPGMVEAVLGADQKPVYSLDGPFEGPRSNGQQATGPAEFHQWYHNTEGVNLPYVIFFSFAPNGNVYTFQSTSFFPLDGTGFGNDGRDHNFHFTTEIHTEFKYNGGETFSFTGDDDLWVFVNGKLAIDLGGVHPQLSATLNLDASAANLGIQAGNIYPLDLFHAERHTSHSNFRVDTNLQFTNCGIIIDEVVR
jgi:fibro-slime domain-containing protein